MKTYFFIESCCLKYNFRDYNPYIKDISLPNLIAMNRRAKNRRNEQAISVLASSIKKYRLAKGLTMTQLANILDVDYSQIGRMERGIVNPNISIIWNIAKTLGVKPSQLLEDVE